MSRVSTYQRTYGQFFTPPAVVRCCYTLLDGTLPAMPRIVDPACGDGAFLRYAVEHALAPPDQIYGCDIDAALVGGLVTGGLPGVFCADGLAPASLVDAAFDLVVGNPPFGIATHTRDSRSFASEVRFLLRALELTRPGGQIVLVLPSGVLANARLGPIRANLLDSYTVLAVIDLPRATFRQSGTSAACSILALRKWPAPPGHQVFFAVAEQLDDLPALVVAYHNRRPTTDDRRPRTENREPRNSDSVVGLPPEAHLVNPVILSEKGPRTSCVAWRLLQTVVLVQRLDASFWRPEYHLLAARMAARHPLLPLGELIDRRENKAGGKGALIAGDHVRPSRGESKGPGLPYEYYQTREFMAAGYNYAAIERCDERAYQRLKYTAVQRHDILISCAGVGGAGKGRVCLVTHRPGPSCTGDVFIMRAHMHDPIFLFLLLASRAGRLQILRLQNGVGTVNLSADELLQIQIPLVPSVTRHGLVARYLPIAAAHDRAMAALIRGDADSFQQERARSERLLAELCYDIEALVIGET